MVYGSTGAGPHNAAISIMLDLARQSATGRLELLHEDGNASWIWLRDGQIASVSTPTQAPLLATRLLQAGLLDAATLAEAQQQARTDPAHPDLTSALLQVRGIRAADVIRARAEELAELLGHALRQPVAHTRFVAGAVLPGTVAVIPTDEVVRAGRAPATQQPVATGPQTYVPPTSPGPPAEPSDLPAPEDPRVMTSRPPSANPSAELDLAAAQAMASHQDGAEEDNADEVDDPEPIRPPTQLRVIANVPDTEEALERQLAEAASEIEMLDTDDVDAEADEDTADADESQAPHRNARPQAVNDISSLEDLLTPMRPTGDAAGSAAALRELASLGRDEPQEDEPPAPPRSRQGRGR